MLAEPSKNETASPIRSLVACAHCGTPTEAVENQERNFCCRGCMGAYALIHELGLDDYYSLRTAEGNPVELGSSPLRDALANPEAAGIAIRVGTDGLACARVSVDGMHCAACSWLLESMRPMIYGLVDARVRWSDQTIELIYDPKRTNLLRVADRYEAIGYRLYPWYPDSDSQSMTRANRDHLMGIAMAAFLAANAMWIGVCLYAGEASGIAKGHENFLRWIGAGLGALAAIGPGGIFFRTAIQSIRTRTPHVDLPVALSLAIGTAGSFWGAWAEAGHIYFDSLASLVLLLRIGRYIQFRAQNKAKTSLSHLLRMQMPVATRISDNGQIEKIPAKQLKRGDLIQVEPGEVVVADGTVDQGSSLLDCSLLTGESYPVAIEPGSELVGGTTNLSNRLIVRVSAVGDESRVGKLMRLVQEAASVRTRWTDAANRVGVWFIGIVLLLSLLTMLGWSWYANARIAIDHTVALLTIACPCALALAAPLVITVTLGRAARNRIWIRDGSMLEKLANPSGTRNGKRQPGIIWFDKTGTLTVGRLQVTRWTGSDDFLAIASEMQKQVHHPIGQAIMRFAAATLSKEQKSQKQKIESLSYRPGLGIVAETDHGTVAIGNMTWLEQIGVSLCPEDQSIMNEIRAAQQTSLGMTCNGVVVGWFALSDTMRSDAAETLLQIQSRGWRLGLLSGDQEGTVHAVADQLARQGIQWEQVHGGKTPEEKVRIVRKSQANGARVVAMIGDGINDAAALAIADIGIAVRGNCNQALTAAPIYASSSRLESIIDLIDASQSVVDSIRLCFLVSLLYNTITISLAVAGFIHPLVAALFMPLSGLTVLMLALNCRAFSKSRNQP